jgi:hypothetical protein
MAKERVVSERLEVALLGSGYAAIHMVVVEDGKGGSYPDVQQTGIGRYATREEAEWEAWGWHLSDKIPIDPGIAAKYEGGDK